MLLCAISIVSWVRAGGSAKFAGGVTGDEPRLGLRYGLVRRNLS